MDLQESRTGAFRTGTAIGKESILGGVERSRLLVGAVLFALALALLGGCGGSDVQEERQDVQEAGQDFQEEQQDVEEAEPGEERQEEQEDVREAQEDLQQEQQDVEEAQEEEQR